jgi:hypothetical protein
MSLSLVVEEGDVDYQKRAAVRPAEGYGMKG